MTRIGLLTVCANDVTGGDEDDYVSIIVIAVLGDGGRERRLDLVILSGSELETKQVES